MANGMTGLYVGLSGLNAAQNALNTTAHNLSNINTTGYTRQQIGFEDSTYVKYGNSANGDMQYGLGVDVSAIRRIRDELIDSAYRESNGRLGYYSSQYEALEEVEDLFGELQGVTYQSALDNFNKALQELAKNPGSTDTRASVVQYATAFIDRSNSVYTGLQKYQSDLNTKVQTSVDKINTLASTIADLNTKISQVEGLGQHANDLRDQRDNALDTLSGLIKIDYKEDSTGKVNVTAEGMPLVTGGTTTTMGTKQAGDTILLTPTWPEYDDRQVFQDYEVINNIDNNDIGELKGLILARGSVSVDYTTVPVEPVKTDYDLTTTEGTAKYEQAMKDYEEKCDYYDKYVEPSVILSTMASVDKLVNGIVTAINDVLCPETTTSFTAADGTVYNNVTVLDMSKTSYGSDDDKTVGTELFSRTGTDRYKQVTGNDGTVYYVRNNTNANGNDSDYTLGNIEVNSIISHDKSLFPLTTAQGGENFDQAQKLVDVWSEKFAALNPKKYAKEDFNTFYNSLVNSYSNVGNVLKTLTSAQHTMTDGYDNQRKATESVSSDEELSNMIKFQQAYNASSRYINAVNEMLEHLVTRLGS